MRWLLVDPTQVNASALVDVDGYLFNAEVSGPGVPLYGNQSIVGRSLVIYKNSSSPTDPPWLCSTLLPATPAKRSVVASHHLLGSVQTCEFHICRLDRFNGTFARMTISWPSRAYDPFSAALSPKTFYDATGPYQIPKRVRTTAALAASCQQPTLTTEGGQLYICLVAASSACRLHVRSCT
jgi:hypothetical protein